MGGNHIYYRNMEIFSGNNGSFDAMWESLLEFAKKKNYLEKEELMSFLDSINQEKYGRGTIGSDITKYFSHQSNDLICLDELLEDTIRKMNNNPLIKKEHANFYISFKVVVQKIYEGKKICRFKNAHLKSYIPLLKSHVSCFVNKDTFESFLNCLQSKENCWHYVDLDDYFEPKSKDVFTLHGLIDLCVEELQKKPYSQYEKECYSSNLRELQSMIYDFYLNNQV